MFRACCLTLFAISILAASSSLAQERTIHELLEAESSAPAQEVFLKLENIAVLVEAWNSLSSRAQVRVLRIAKLHRDQRSRQALVHLGCGEADLSVRKACIDMAQRSPVEGTVTPLLAAAAWDDREGNRAARLLMNRATADELRSLGDLLVQHPARSALASATAQTYWRAVTSGRSDTDLGARMSNVIEQPSARRQFLLTLAKYRPESERDPAGLLASAIQMLEPGASFEDRYYFLQAAERLSHDSRKVDTWIKEHLTHELWMLREVALQAALARAPVGGAAPLLIAALEDESPRLRRAALRHLRAQDELPPARRLRSFRAALDEERWPIVRAEAVIGLASVGAFEDTARQLADPARRVREQAMRSLAKAPKPLQAEAAKHVLRKDPEWPQVQIAALEVIETNCLPLFEAVARFIRREDARAERLNSEDALRKAIGVYAAIAPPSALEALLSELRSAMGRAAARPLPGSIPAPRCLDMGTASHW